MIDPSPAQHALLSAIIAAGSSGLRIDVADVSRRLGDLSALAIDELVDVTADRRVIATPKGRAFRTRTAA